MRYILLIVIFFLFKAGKAINRFDVSETIGHSPKQSKNYKKEVSDDWDVISSSYCIRGFLFNLEVHIMFGFVIEFILNYKPKT